MAKVKKFWEIGVITNIERLVHYRLAHSSENIAILSESVSEDPNVYILRRPEELGLYCCLLSHILYLDLHLHPNKI